MDSRLKFLPRAETVKTEAVTQKARQAGGWKSQFKEAGWGDSEAHFPVRQRSDKEPVRAKLLKLSCQEKPL